MRYIFLILITTILSANILDDYNIYKAQDSYSNSDLNSTIKYYKNIDNKSDTIKYNLANALYKQKKYDEAISYYSKITSKDMLFKKHHNLANSYAKLGKLDTAIKNYEEALKIQDDKDTKFNLDLLKKKKKQQDKKNKNKKNKKNKKDKNQDKKRKSDKQKDQKDDMDKEDKKDEKTSSNKKQDEIKEKKDNKSNNKDKAKKAKQEQIKKQDANITKEENLKNTQLSNLEEKKWSKLLNNKELNTLMIPLKNKGSNDEKYIKPW